MSDRARVFIMTTALLGAAIAMAFLLSGCATGDVVVQVGEQAVATVKGNAPGRTIIYESENVKITVKDERTPNPAKGLIDLFGNFFKAMWSKADVAIPLGGD